MKKVLPAIAVVAIFSLGSLAQEIQKDDFKAFAEIKTVESAFTIKKYLSIADEPLVSEGKFYFKSPDMLRWEYTSPFRYGIVLSGCKALSWQEENGKKIIKDVSGKPAASAMSQQLCAFISMDIGGISKYYRIEKTPDGIALFPKKNSKKQMIERINIAFSKNAAAVAKVEIIEKNGDKTVISFSGTKIDEVIAENAFIV